MGRVPVRVGSFFQSSKGRQTYPIVVVEVGGPWTFKPRRLPKRLDRLLMSRFLLKSTTQEKEPGRGWRDSQQALERCNGFVSATRNVKQAPGPLELSLRIVWSDSENSPIRVGSRLVTLQA